MNFSNSVTDRVARAPSAGSPYEVQIAGPAGEVLKRQDRRTIKGAQLFTVLDAVRDCDGGTIK